MKQADVNNLFSEFQIEREDAIYPPYHGGQYLEEYFVSKYLADKPNPDVTAPVYSGQGVLQLKTKSKGVVVADNIGTVDYDTGELDIVSLNITEISGVANDELRVVATPHESSRNISTDILVRTTEEQSYAVFAQPSRNIILNLDDAAEDTVNNIRKGLNVQMVERIVDE